MGGGARRAAPPARTQRNMQQSGPGFGGPRSSINFGVGPMLAPSMFGPPLLVPPMGLFGPPVMAVPTPFGSPSFMDQALQDQQRRDKQQINGQQAQIDSLQKELAELKA